MGYFWLNSNSKLRAILSPRFESLTKSCEVDVDVLHDWEWNVYLSGFYACLATTLMATSASSPCFLRTNRLSDAEQGEKKTTILKFCSSTDEHYRRECWQFARGVIKVEGRCGRRGQSDAVTVWYGPWHCKTLPRSQFLVSSGSRTPAPDWQFYPSPPPSPARPEKKERMSRGP